jgi:Domain of unknown function (DUF4188)
MAKVAGRRTTAEIEGDFVVFLIGARFNSRLGISTIVHYWRSCEHLEAFAKDRDDPHVAVWRQYWKRVGKSGRTGIWHETYLVKAGQYEAAYGNMPPHGLGKAGRLVPAVQSSTARGRLEATAVEA